jgi:sugar phosphate isomerase/epimerase
MKISFSTLACPDWDLDTIVARAAEYGYDAVDFRCLGRAMDVYKLPEFSTDLAATRRKFRDAGLEISGFSTGARMFAPSADKRAEHLETVKRYAELSDLLDVEFIRVFGGKTEGVPLSEAIDASVEALGAMSRQAGPTKIAVETHDDWVDSAKLAAVMDKVSAANVFVLWDLHHPFRLAGESPEQTYANIGPRTRYTHVKDSLPSDDGGFVLTLGGGGDVPLAEMVELLRRGGYDGWLTLEWEKLWHPDIAPPEVALPAYAKYLRRLADA